MKSNKFYFMFISLFLFVFLNHRQVLSTGFVSIYISVFEYYQTLSLYPIISLFVYLLYLRLLHQIQMSNKFYFMSWSWILDHLENTRIFLCICFCISLSVLFIGYHFHEKVFYYSYVSPHFCSYLIYSNHFKYLLCYYVSLWVWVEK